jgi:hypothetical protein
MVGVLPPGEGAEGIIDFLAYQARVDADFDFQIGLVSEGEFVNELMVIEAIRLGFQAASSRGEEVVPDFVAPPKESMVTSFASASLHKAISMWTLEDIPKLPNHPAD